MPESLFPDGFDCPDCRGDVIDPDTGEACWCSQNPDDVAEALRVRE